MKKGASPLSDLVAYRKSLGETQTEFWTRFGVTQSGGSRYEAGRAVPTPVSLWIQAFSDGLVCNADLAKLLRKVQNQTPREHAPPKVFKKSLKSP